MFASHHSASAWTCTTLYVTVSPQIRKKYITTAGQGGQGRHGVTMQWGDAVGRCSGRDPVLRGTRHGTVGIMAWNINGERQATG